MTHSIFPKARMKALTKAIGKKGAPATPEPAQPKQSSVFDFTAVEKSHAPPWTAPVSTAPNGYSGPGWGSDLPTSKGSSLSRPDYPVPLTVDTTLECILSWPRAHGSWTEKEFCAWLKLQIVARGAAYTVLELDCIKTEIPRPDGLRSKVMFSSHVDTIDPMMLQPHETNAIPRKKLIYDPNFGHIALDTSSLGGSLGADDGAGVWLMLELIAAKVPGTYVFHRGEEVGGLGSRAIVVATSPWIAGLTSCVAFDRAHDYEIITHQGGERCASDKYGLALAASFNKQGLDYGLSTRGTFTDSKMYRMDVAECVNIGVGYDSQHGRGETLDYSLLSLLRDAVVGTDWEILPTSRDPKAKPVYTAPPAPAKWSGSYKPAPPVAPPAKSKVKRVDPELSVLDDLAGNTYADLVEWCESEPADVATSLIELMREATKWRAEANLFQALCGHDADDSGFKF